MNVVCLVGRLTKRVEVRFPQTPDGKCFAKFTVAVDRQKKGEADFISCVAFGKTAEYLAKYSDKGMRIALSGRIQTGSYQKTPSDKVYTTDVIVDQASLIYSGEVSQSNASQGESEENQPSREVGEQETIDGFYSVDNLMDEGLPFN